MSGADCDCGTGWECFEGCDCACHEERAGKRAHGGREDGRMTETEPILDYDPERACPKCGNGGAVDRYGDLLAYIRGLNGELISVASARSPRHPHLVVRCIDCGWEWLSETKDAGTDA